MGLGYGSTARGVGVMLMTPGSSGKLEESQSTAGKVQQQNRDQYLVGAVRL